MANVKWYKSYFVGYVSLTSQTSVKTLILSVYCLPNIICVISQQKSIQLTTFNDATLFKQVRWCKYCKTWKTSVKIIFWCAPVYNSNATAWMRFQPLRRMRSVPPLNSQCMALRFMLRLYRCVTNESSRCRRPSLARKTPKLCQTLETNARTHPPMRRLQKFATNSANMDAYK